VTVIKDVVCRRGWSTCGWISRNNAYFRNWKSRLRSFDYLRGGVVI